MVICAVAFAAETSLQTVRHDNLGGETHVYYAPQLERVRIDSGGSVTLIDYKRGDAYMRAESSAGWVKRSFREFDKQQERISRDSLQVGGFVPPEKPMDQLRWRVKRESAGNECSNIILANQHGEESNMCVIRDARVKQLDFIRRYLKRTPMELRGLLESSEELFLYAQGMVPIRGKRRGSEFTQEPFMPTDAKAKLFSLPSAKELVGPAELYRSRYFEAMFPSEKK